MRKTITLIAAVLLVLGVAACGGDSKKTTTKGSDTTDSSSSKSSSKSKSDTKTGSGSAFCDDLKGLENDFGSDFNISSDPQKAKDAINKLRDLNPPSEIKNEWGEFLDYLDVIVNMNSSNAKDAASAIQEASKHAAALQKVTQYFVTKCGIGSQSDLSDLSSLTDLSSYSDYLSSLSDQLSSLSSSFSS